MAEIKHGSVTITVPDALAPPPEAGKLSGAEVARMPKAPHGIGLACARAADAMDKAGEAFAPPAGITPEALREAGRRADDYDQLLVDLDVARTVVSQANLIADGHAWELIRKLNDQVKAQGKHAPELLTIFQQLVEFFARARNRRTAPAENPPA